MSHRLSVAAIALLAACAGGRPPAPKPIPLPTFATDAEIRDAATLITPEKVLTRISVIADDSMGGRNTPSPGLEKTAQYLADNYQRWGFTPMGDSGTFFQRYTPRAAAGTARRIVARDRPERRAAPIPARPVGHRDRTDDGPADHRTGQDHLGRRDCG